MMDFTTRAASCNIFYKIDLKKGYHQIPMHLVDIPKTATTTPFGLFEFLRITFGMRNTGNTFQRLMDRTLLSLDFAFPCLNNIFINQQQGRVAALLSPDGGVEPPQRCGADGKCGVVRVQEGHHRLPGPQSDC